MTAFAGFGYAWPVTGSLPLPERPSRLGYLDWARGLAVLLMIHTHGLFAWTAPDDRDTRLFGVTRLAGGFPAALFLFLAGLSAALVAERERRKGVLGAEIRGRALHRALTVFGYAIAFRVWMLASGGFGRFADLLRVDVLNCIAVSLALVALVLRPDTRRHRGLAAGGLAVAIAVLTPLAWDAVRWQGWPTAVAGYFTGRVPDALFPIFPWTAFAAVGAACGVGLAAARDRQAEGRAIAGLAALGAAAIPLALLADRRGPALYPSYDYWYTSPSYVALKAGIVLLLLAASYVADKAPGQAPIRLLGRTSLFVYWAHLEIVYGRWLTKGAQGSLTVETAAWSVAVLVVAMVLLAVVRTRGREWWLGRTDLAHA
jgi:uncharacterized membrane protein